MKYSVTQCSFQDEGVAPLVGAWIEIRQGLNNLSDNIVAPLVGAWIEIQMINCQKENYHVAPLVGAWIEIFSFPLFFY